MINKENFKEELKNIPVGKFPSDLKELHDFVMESTDGGTFWEPYEDLGIKPVMDHYFERLNDFLKGKDSQAKSKAEEPRKKETKVKAPKVKKEKPQPEAKPVPQDQEESSVEMVERMPEEIKFIRRYIALNGKKKEKYDLLLFINALHRAINTLVLRAASPYANHIRYIQKKLVSKHNTMSKPEIYSIPAKTVEELKDIIHSYKIMPSINLIKRYITLNGRYGVKEKAKGLVEAMKNAFKKGKVAKNDKYHKLYQKMLSNLNTYIRNKSQKILSIEESELNGLNGIIDEYPTEELGAPMEVERSEGNSDTSLKYRRTNVMSLDEAKRSQFQTIGLEGQWKLLIGKACMPTHALIYGEGGSGKTSCALKYSEYLNQLGHKILYIAGEQYNTPTFTELLTNLNISGNENFVLVKDLHAVPLKDFEFVVLDSKDSLDLDVNDFRALKKTHPSQSFIITSQGTKTGDFTGSGQWRNEVDTMILCDKGIAKTIHDKNRWGGKGELKIYDDQSSASLNGKPKSLSTQEDKLLYDVLSPDGFTIRMPGDALFKTRPEGVEYFKKWKKRFEAQGYYSFNAGRIPLIDLQDECTWAEVPMSDADSWMGLERDNFQIVNERRSCGYS